MDTSIAQSKTTKKKLVSNHHTPYRRRQDTPDRKDQNKRVNPAPSSSTRDYDAKARQYGGMGSSYRIYDDDDDARRRGMNFNACMISDSRWDLRHGNSITTGWNSICLVYVGLRMCVCFAGFERFEECETTQCLESSDRIILFFSGDMS